MKTLKILIALIILNLIAALTAPALTTTNLLAPVFLQTVYTNGQTVVYYTIALPYPQILVATYDAITNSAGTNTLGFQGTLAVASGAMFNIYPLQTNASSDTYTASQIPGASNGTFTATLTLQGSITNAGGTNMCQLQWMHQ